MSLVAWTKENAKTTMAVGSRPANRWGIHDLKGNVLEWCSDWYTASSVDVDDPTGPATGSDKVARGGSFEFNAADCRAAARWHFPPTTHFNIIGFRVVIPE